MIAAAVVIALWGAPSYAPGATSYASSIEQACWLMILYGVSYVLFAWVLRLRSFVLSLIITSVCIVTIRLVLISSH